MNRREQAIVQNIESFANNAHKPSDCVVSIKFRPVHDKDRVSDRYVYPAEYRQLVQEFGLTKISSSGFSGSAVYQDQDGILFLEHESGPEILTFILENIDTLSESIAPFLDIINGGALVLGAFAWIHNKIRQNCKTNNPDRFYHDVLYIKIEIRMTGPHNTLAQNVAMIVGIDKNLDQKTIGKAIKSAVQSMLSKSQDQAPE